MATKAAIFLMKSFQKVVAPKVFHELKSAIANATNSETLKAHSMQGMTRVVNSVYIHNNDHLRNI